MSFDDLINGTPKPAAAPPRHESSDWPAAQGGRPWGQARRKSSAPQPLPFVPEFPAPEVPRQEEDAPINKKGILADVANIGWKIQEDFAAYKKSLKEQGPLLTSLKWRAEVFLNLLKALKKAGHLRTPAIQEEYEKIIQQYESIHFKRTGHLTSHVRNYLSEWVCPIAATAPSGASRVHFITAIQGALRARADSYYADYLGFCQSLGAFQADLDHVWDLMDEIDGVIASFTSKELPCDLKSFIESVEGEQIPETAERNNLVVMLRNLKQPSAAVEEHMVRLCGWGAKLKQWLEHPEMPPAPLKKDGIIREGTVEGLKHVANAYQNDKLADLGKNMQDLGRPLELALDTLRKISQGLGVAENLTPEAKSWARASADGAVPYLESILTRLKEASRSFYDLKAMAESRYAAITRSIEVRKAESPAPEGKISLREAIDKAMQISIKGPSWWSYLSAPFAWRWRSTPAAVEELPVGLGILEKRLAALDWVKARQITFEYSLEPLFADDAAAQALKPAEGLRRQNVPPAEMKLEDYWHKAVCSWSQMRGLIDQALAYNHRGAHLKATYQLLKQFMEQMRTKHASAELEKLKPLLALSLAQLREDCANHRPKRLELSLSLNRHLSEIGDNRKKLQEGLQGTLPGLDQSGNKEERDAAIKQVIQQLDLLHALLHNQLSMFEQTDEIEQWLSQNDKWMAACGKFFYSSEDPFAPKSAELKQPPPRKLAAGVSVVMPVEQEDKKPAELGKQLQDKKWIPEQFVDEIEKKLPELIQTAKQWELEKLNYHDGLFKRICGSIHRMEEQMGQLFAAICHLEQIAAALATLYGAKPQQDKKTPLVQQLQFLKSFQDQLARAAAVCKEQSALGIELLKMMAREESLKMTAEKINWRKQQENYLTRTREGNQRRLGQLQRGANLYHFAALRLSMLWDIAVAAYKKAEERVEALNYLQNAIPGKLYGYYPPAPLHANPLTQATEPLKKD